MAGDLIQPSSKPSAPPKLLAALEKLRTKAHRSKSGNIIKSQVIDLVSNLESDNHSVCSGIDSKTSCTIIQTLLECHGCRDSERGTYLIGAALYYDSLSQSKKLSIVKKKQVIGKECLGQLIDFFIDGSNANSMRQWVGVLVLQLFQYCDSNIQMFELGPEKQRRELGNIVLKEPNEIIRIICGQVITSLLSAGVFPEHMWPINIDKKLFEDFPKISPGSRGWNQQFQNYMDNVFEVMEPTDSIGQLYFTQNVSLTPQYNFGPEDHNIVIVIEAAKMTIWAGVVADIQNFNHCLEVPLAMIHKMLINPRSDSQLSGVLNVHLFLEATGEVCYLDCASTALSQICMVLQQSVVEAIQDELRIVCPHLEVINEDTVNPDNFNNRDSQQDDQHHSQSIQAVHCSGNGTSVIRPRSMSLAENGHFEAESGVANAKTAQLITKAKATLAIVGSPQLGLKQVNHNEPSTKDTSKSGAEIDMVNDSMQAHTPKKPTVTERRHSYAPKPKAKIPLRQVQKPKTDNEQWSSASGIAPLPDQPISNGLSYEEPTTNDSFKVNGQLNNSIQLQGEIEALKSHPQQANKTGLLAVQDVEPKKHSLKRTSKDIDHDDCYDIPPEEIREGHLLASKSSLEDMKPITTVPTTRKTVTTNAAENNKQPTKTTKKKRQSAPAALEPANNRGRLQRRAAAVASKKLIEVNSSDDEQLISEESKHENSKPIQQMINSATTNSRQPLREVVNTGTIKNDQTLMLQRQGQQDDSHSLQLTENNFPAQPSDDLHRASPTKLTATPVHQGNISEYPQVQDDLYDATPIKPTTKLVCAKVAAPNKPSCVHTADKRIQSLGEMAAKMGSLLGGLDEPNVSEDISAKKVEVRAKIRPRKLSDMASEQVLVNDYLCRKTPVVGFNDKGARNQGPSAKLASSVAHPKIDQPKQLTPTRADGTEDRKRKREKPKGEENSSPPRKRQSRSPSPNRTPVQSNADHYFGSSPPQLYQPKNLEKSPSLRLTVGLTTLPQALKPNSQGSRVDKNGSPVAPSSHVDRIGNVKRKLHDEPVSEVHTPKPTRRRPLFTSPEFFGPKLSFGSIPKARPSSSLEETASRYIPHKKIRNGLYEAFNGNEVIAPEKALIDPFLDNMTRPTNRFSDRLLAGSSSATAGNKKSKKVMHHLDLNRDNMKTTTLAARPTNYRELNPQANTRVPKRLTEVFMDEDEETLVERGNRSSSDKLSPPEMTSDTTYDSGSPLTDKSKNWNNAVRPHYTNLSETIHHIADEVIIRLADEEDAVKLIASQYKENGDKLLNQAAQKRSEEKAAMARKMNQRKEDMVALYTDAKGLADRTKQAIEKSPLSAVERVWKTKCEALQAQIDKGKRASEE